MDIGMLVWGTLVGGVILFLWSGLTQQLLPTGIKSVKEPSGDAAERIGTAIAQETQNGMRLVNKGVTAFIVVRPEEYYAPARYLVVEGLTQLLAALCISGLLALTVALPLEQRILVVVLAGLAGVSSIDLQNWNWWGFASGYTITVALARLVGYAVAGGVMAMWIIR